jgi:CheY-like chemotaxis protein
MEPTVTHVVRKSPFPSPSDAPSGSCPSRAALSPSAVVAGAAPPLGGGTARLTDAVLTEKAPPIRSSHLYVDSELNRPLFLSAPDDELAQAPNVDREQRAGYSVLVVEDDPDISMSLQDLLEFEGFHVNCVPTCHQALSSIEQHAYDAVLLDLGLPDGDGLSVLEKVQASHPALSVIILTASNRDLGSARAYARLTKPWNRKELCTLLRQATGQAPSSIMI